MKKLKRKFYVWAITHFAHHLKLRKIQTVDNRVIILAPSTIGSAGDEAMMVAICEQMIAMNKTVFVLSAKVGWAERLGLYGIDVSERVISRLYRRPSALLNFRRLVYKLAPAEFYVIGADVVDGYYSKIASIQRLTMLELLIECCPRVRLVGFSFNDAPTEMVCMKFKQLSNIGVQLFVRDPVSFARLEALGVAATLSADLAFLLSPNRERKALAHFSLEADNCRRQGGCVIAINVNDIHCSLEGKAFLEKVLATVLTIINSQSLILLVPHDFRLVKGESDYTLAEKLQTRLAETGYRSLLAPSDLLASEAKYIASLADFAISGRMHFAIAAIGQAVPTVMFSYQGKQAGVLRHVHLDPDQYLIDYRADVDVMKSSVVSAFANRHEAKNTISLALPNVKKLASASLRD